jgi:acyl CoA:acetate/3-ketoacid CoA transferase beta subunit
MSHASDLVERADVCVVAMAECFRGDGEILANPIGTIPMIGGRLARATFEPDLAMTDGEARLIANDEAFEWPEGKIVEHFNPYRAMFGWVWNGRRHVVMGGSQIDQYGNQNFAAIGEYRQPKVQLLGYRGAPGNTINDTTSYCVANHSRNVLVPLVDTVCGVGYDRTAALGERAARFHEIRFVVTNLAVLDFGGPDHRMRLLSVHPGVTVDDVVTATGFELAIGVDGADTVEETRPPTPEETEVIARLDPKGMRNQEVSGG